MLCRCQFPPQAVGRSRRSVLSPCETHNTRRFERGKCLRSAAFININELLPAQHSHRPPWPRSFGRFRFCLRCSWVGLRPCVQRTRVYTGVGRTGGDQGKLCQHKGGGCLCFWHSCHRGQSLAFLCQESDVDELMACLLLCLLKAFTGSHPFSELAPADAVFKMVIDCELPDRPQERGLTDPVWDMTVRCWQHEPDRRPKTTEVVAALREWQAFHLLGHEHRDVTSSSFLQS